MFDDDAGRALAELLDAFKSRIGIGNVVIRELLALQLPGCSERGFLDIIFDVEGGLLVRVLAVAHDLGTLVLEGQGAREIGTLRIDSPTEPVGDGGIIGGGALINLQRQTEVGLTGNVTLVGGHLIENDSIISRIDNHCDGLVVLGGAAQHGRAANIDILDGVLEGAVGLGNGCFEGV